MKNLQLLAGAICAAISTSASAQPKEDGNFYVGIDLGVALSDGSADYIGTTADTFGGTPIFDIDNTSIVGGVAVGYRFSRFFRSEVEFRRRELSTVAGLVSGVSSRADDLFALNGDVDSRTLMLAGYIDLPRFGAAQPYLKAGAGAAFNEGSAIADFTLNSDIWSGTGLQGTTLSDVAYPENHNTVFAWEVGAGLTVPLSEKLMLDIEYQYLDAGDINTGTDSNGDAIRFDDLATHETTVGLRYNF